MQTYDLDSWNDFRGIVLEIREQYGRLKLTETVSKKNVVLFRGQGDANWPLSTTLERWTDREITIQNYMVYAVRCSNELESLTGKKWDIPSLQEITRIETSQDSFRVHLLCYDYLVYLRPHGFPSPLLDWTASPYIAAYFAYCDRPSNDRVAVYAYIERPRGVKEGIGGSPQISLMGPSIRTHSRHFARKSWYTICTKYHYTQKSHIFSSHSGVFSADDKDDEALSNEQYLLIKITLPTKERLPALEELNDYNIDHFTLFQTEDALIKALAIREFEVEST
jgi:hypothetical protein